MASNRKPHAAPAPAPVVETPVVETPVATLVVAVAIVNVCLSKCFELGKGLIFPSPWVEWTPVDPTGKPGVKRAEEGVVDVNALLRGTTITKPTDKGLAARLMTGWLTTPPTEGVIVGKNGNGTPVSHVLQAGLTVGQTLVGLLVKRGVRCFHHQRNLEWSGTDKSGQTIFGIGEDWPLFQKTWNDCKGNPHEVEKAYGFLPWGQPLMSQANAISLYDKGSKAGFDLAEYVKVGRGKKAKVIVTSGFSLEEFEGFAASFKDEK